MTKKKSQTLYMSLLPVILIIGLVLGGGYLLMGGDIKQLKFNRDPQIRRLEGFPTSIPTSEIFERKRIVIKSQAELEEFLKAADKTGLTALGEKIDFEKEYLLGVTSSTFSTDGFEVKIRKLYEDKEADKLIVSIRQVTPPESCVLEPYSNVWVELVAIDKTEKEIQFETVKEEAKECPSGPDTE